MMDEHIFFFCLLCVRFGHIFKENFWEDLLIRADLKESMFQRFLDFEGHLLVVFDWFLWITFEQLTALSIRYQ